jgi:hypothetical protein
MDRVCRSVSGHSPTYVLSVIVCVEWRTVFAVYEVACVTQPRLFLRCCEPRI